MTAISVLGIDLGKNSCSVVGLDAAGEVVLRRRVRATVSRRCGPSCRPAWWRWRRAAGRIILAASCVTRATRSG